jgi:hypothetical protein
MWTQTTRRLRASRHCHINLRQAGVDYTWYAYINLGQAGTSYRLLYKNGIWQEPMVSYHGVTNTCVSEIVAV